MNFMNPALKALMFDVAITPFIIGYEKSTFSTLATIGASAFTSYFLRDAANSYVSGKVESNPSLKYLPIAVGGVAGALKYYSKGSDFVVGAFNNAAYEASSVFLSGPFNNIFAPVTIEGADCLFGYVKSNTNIDFSRHIDERGDLNKTQTSFNLTTTISAAEAADNAMLGMSIGAGLIFLGNFYEKLMETETNQYSFVTKAGISGLLLAQNVYDFGNKIFSSNEDDGNCDVNLIRDVLHADDLVALNNNSTNSTFFDEL